MSMSSICTEIKFIRFSGDALHSSLLRNGGLLKSMICLSLAEKLLIYAEAPLRFGRLRTKRAFPLSTSAIVVFVIACGNAAGASEKMKGCGKTGADA
ncbi:hypothetical protein DOT66_22135 [Ralstonia pseudosolanacearum]|nr:hypothetical protein CFM90_20215 [Ralstonia solanacearum]RAA05467.1 hypothetical protein DOT66_22135 [Ralstonia pseudosolanacearum]